LTVIWLPIDKKPILIFFLLTSERHLEMENPWHLKRERFLSGGLVMSMKSKSNGLTGVNFINILSANFLYKSVLRSFTLITFWLCNFLQKNIDTKAACKMLMKLITILTLFLILIMIEFFKWYDSFSNSLKHYLRIWDARSIRSFHKHPLMFNKFYFFKH
jgi:hypothetical protein